MFLRGNEHPDLLVSDPQLAADVAQAHADAEEIDRAHAMNLAMIRKAAHMTQVEVAGKLGVGQGAISRLEITPTCSYRRRRRAGRLQRP